MTTFFSCVKGGIQEDDDLDNTGMSSQWGAGTSPATKKGLCCKDVASGALCILKNCDTHGSQSVLWKAQQVA